MNARFGNIQSPAIGANAISVCPTLACHRRPVLTFLEHCGLYALNTFMGESDDYTWAHVSGALHKIDYVFLGQRMMDAVSQFKLGEWGEFDLSTTTDHRSLVFSLSLGKVAKCKGRPKRIRFQDDSHRAAFVDAIQHGVLGSWDMQAAPETFLNLL
eukprot:1277814-Amphidinium_carterae.1